MEQHARLSTEALIHFEGEIAFRVGTGREDNPYWGPTTEHAAWWAGWDEAADTAKVTTPAHVPGAD